MRLILVLILCGLPMPALADGEKPVDVAIVVSYDRSESIDRAEAHTQIQGTKPTLFAIGLRANLVRCSRPWGSIPPCPDIVKS